MLFRFLLNPFGVFVQNLDGEFLINSFAFSKTGVQCANSGNTTNFTGRKGALPATAESIIEMIRSVFFRISPRFVGLSKSV